MSPAGGRGGAAGLPPRLSGRSPKGEQLRAILADLIENFEARRVHNPFYRLLMRLGGVLDPDCKMPIDMQASFRANRAEVRKAVQAMLDWAPERIILAHGRCYEKGAVAELRRAFRWIL